MLKLTVLLMPRAYIRTKGLVEGILNENVNCEIILCGSKGLVDDCNLAKFSDEFLLRGGFGEIDVESDFSVFALNNCKCSLNNCNCYYNPGEGAIDNCSCSYKYDASSNNCDCNTTGTTKPTKPTPSVDPTITPTSFL